MQKELRLLTRLFNSDKIKMKALQISTPFLPVAPDLKYGGSERVLYLLDSELNKLGYSAGVVAPEGSNPASKLYPTIPRAIGVDDVLDKAKNSAFTGFALRADHAARAIKYANELEGIDLVHLHDDNILPFDFLINRPSLVTLHSDIDSFWDLSITPFVGKRKSKLVSISQSQKKIYESKGHKVDYVVYNGVDENVFSLSDKKHPYLLSLGGINPVKGQRDAIEVGKRTGLDVILAGNIGNAGYFETEIKPHITHDLTKESDKLGTYLSLPSASPKVVYVGPVTDVQKAPLYSNATAFLMPIHWEEPFGLVLVESMLSGTPVIAYNRGSIPEIVKDGTGIIVPAENLEEMIHSVNQIGSFSPEECRRIAAQEFGKSRMAHNYLAVYEDILNQKN